MDYLHTRRVKGVENWRIDLSGFAKLRRYVGRYRDSSGRFRCTAGEEGDEDDYDTESDEEDE